MAWQGPLVQSLVGVAILSTNPVLAESPVPEQGERANLPESVNRVFGVSDSELMFLSVAPAPGQAQMVWVQIDGENAVLDLRPHSVRSNDYRLVAETAPGVYESVVPGIETTLRGTVLGLPDTLVAASLDEHGLTARIRMPFATDYWLEPVARHLAGAPDDLYILYKNADVLPTGGLCAADELNQNLPANEDVPVIGGRRSAAGVSICVTELACDADFEYFSNYGSISAVENRINLVINTVNMQYETEVGIEHQITQIIVRTNSSDPYTASDSSALLTEFRNEWNLNQTGITRDIAHLFTGRDLDGNVIGVAYVGVVCHATFGYGLSQSDFSGNIACVTDLTAHEVGHNWNAGHCLCPGNTMNASLTCGNTFEPTDTVPVIVAHRDSRACLDCAVLNAAPLDSFTIRKGSMLSGNLASLATSDDSSLKISSTAGQKARTITNIFATSPDLDITQIQLRIETGVTKPDVRTSVFLYNHNRAEWVRITSFAQSRGDSIRILTVTDRPNRFVDGTGEIRVRIKMKRGGAFVSRIDQVEIKVTPV